MSAGFVDRPAVVLKWATTCVPAHIRVWGFGKGLGFKGCAGLRVVGIGFGVLRVVGLPLVCLAHIRVWGFGKGLGFREGFGV